MWDISMKAYLEADIGISEIISNLSISKTFNFEIIDIGKYIKFYPTNKWLPKQICVLLHNIL